MAIRKLRDLRHTGNIQYYIKQFFEIILDIRDVSKKVKDFSLVEEMKSWTKTKLHKQSVQDLSMVYATAKQLFNLSSNNQSQDVR